MIAANTSREIAVPQAQKVTVESIQQQRALSGVTPDVQQELGNLLRALGNPDGIYATARKPEAITLTTFEQFATHTLLKHILSYRRDGTGL